VKTTASNGAYACVGGLLAPLQGAASYWAATGGLRCASAFARATADRSTPGYYLSTLRVEGRRSPRMGEGLHGRLRGLRDTHCATRRNPFRVDGFVTRVPRVARSSQSWALGRNPFGILCMPSAFEMRVRCRQSEVPTLLFERFCVTESAVAALLCRRTPNATARLARHRAQRMPC